MGLAVIYLMVAFLMSVAIYTDVDHIKMAKENEINAWNLFLRLLLVGLFWPFVIVFMTVYFIYEYVYGNSEKPSK
jgi:cytochrome c biogenesis factor